MTAAQRDLGAESAVPIEWINTEGRHRRDLGDINGLAESIAEVGLIQPIVVTSDYRLIAGERRIAAHRHLGRTHIQARVTDQFDDARLALLAERDENTCRKPMTPEELVDMGLEIERLERPRADDRKREGQLRGGEIFAGREAWDPAGSQASSSVNNKTAAIVGEALGVSRNTYNRAKHVVQTARGETAATPEVQGIARGALDAMNSGTATITGAYNEIREARKVDAEPLPAPRPPAPPKYGGNRRKHLQMLDAIVVGLSGYQIIVGEIKDSGLDNSVSKEQAARLADGLTKAIRSLNRMNTLLKERTK